MRRAHLEGTSGISALVVVRDGLPARTTSAAASAGWQMAPDPDGALESAAPEPDIAVQDWLDQVRPGDFEEGSRR